jgi:hypothetical protein
MHQIMVLKTSGLLFVEVSELKKLLIKNEASFDLNISQIVDYLSTYLPIYLPVFTT